MNSSFSFVIPTYNRPVLIERAIESIFRQPSTYDIEIIVIDDCSNIDYKKQLLDKHPQICFERLQKNQGPGVARNRGIELSSKEWIVVLDDDDQLTSNCLESISTKLQSYLNFRPYPVFNFSRSNGILSDEFILVRREHYLNGAIDGDFLPVLQRRVFLENGLSYPDLKIGGESLLWWDVADRWGIPSWNTNVCLLGTDAPFRITDIKNQLDQAEEYVKFHVMTLRKFTDLKTESPATFIKCQLGAAIYCLLSRQRKKSRQHTRQILKRKLDLHAIAILLLTFFPICISRVLFIHYKRRSKP